MDVSPAMSRRLDFPIVLFHGWGFDKRIWQPLLPLLNQWADVYNVDLFYDHSDPNRMCAGLIEQIPSKAIVCGWSLGGMLATRLACRYPDSIVGLVTLAANTSFIARNHCSAAMPMETFTKFANTVRQDIEKGLKRFAKLVSYGDKNSDKQYHWLLSRIPSSLTLKDRKSLLVGLELLMSVDNSALIGEVQCPSLHLFGGQDVLVPECTMSTLQPLLGDHQSLQVITNSGHLLHYPPQPLVSILEQFFFKRVME